MKLEDGKGVGEAIAMPVAWDIYRINYKGISYQYITIRLGLDYKSDLPIGLGQIKPPPITH